MSNFNFDVPETVLVKCKFECVDRYGYPYKEEHSLSDESQAYEMIKFMAEDGIKVISVDYNGVKLNIAPSPNIKTNTPVPYGVESTYVIPTPVVVPPKEEFSYFSISGKKFRANKLTGIVQIYSWSPIPKEDEANYGVLGLSDINCITNTEIKLFKRAWKDYTEESGV